MCVTVVPRRDIPRQRVDIMIIINQKWHQLFSGADPGFFKGGWGWGWLVPCGCKCSQKFAFVFENWNLVKTVSLEILAMPQSGHYNEEVLQRVCLYFYQNVRRDLSIIMYVLLLQKGGFSVII